MRKFVSLCMCESSKLRRKKSYKVMLILILVAIILSVVMSFFIKGILQDANYDKNRSLETILGREIETKRAELQSGTKFETGEKLTEDEKKAIEDEIKIDEYRIENDMAPLLYERSEKKLTRRAYDYLSNALVMTILTVMIIVVAGSQISGEFSKGTIKFWSFTPNKRWKILLAKFLVCTKFLIIITVIATAVSVIAGNIFFGADNNQAYLYVSGGQVKELNYYVYILLYNLLGAAEIFIFMVLALMLSTITRNTAVAVGVSTALYLGGPTVTTIFNIFIKKSWIKYNIFNNLNLAERVFSDGNLQMAMRVVGQGIKNYSIQFSIILISCYLLVMIFAMFNNFRRRDMNV